MQVTIARDPFQPSMWKCCSTTDLCALLKAEFGEQLPSTARIYNKYVARNCDVTPSNELEIERLNKLEGPITVVVYPGDPVWIIIAAVALLALAAALIFLMPKAQTQTPKREQQSPNNSLSDRQNDARLNGRIPDILGELRSTPDMLAQPYSIFDKNRQVEICYMCIGRGYYQILDARDDKTAISEILGSAIEVYDPYTSPNTGGAQYTVGNPITEPFISVVRCSGVNGETLRSPNYKTKLHSGLFGHLRFEYPSTVRSNYTDGFDFTDYVDVGDLIDIANAGFSDGALSGDLSGRYEVATVDSDFITLVDPSAVNTDWNTVGDLPSDRTDYITADFDASGFKFADKIIGPFVLASAGDTSSKLIINISASGNAYKTRVGSAGNSHQYGLIIHTKITATPCDVAGTPTGADIVSTVSVFGSSISKEPLNVTEYIDISAAPSKYYKVSGKRLTDTLFDPDYTVVDEIQWRDLYTSAPITETDFGNVTTVRSRTLATQQSTNIKNRKINLLVKRKLPQRVGSTSTFTDIAPTKSAADAICALALDPLIGNRTIDELDVDSVYDTIAEAVTYFGTAEAGEFSYTFDSDNLSFEEIITAVAEACFCKAFRRGNKLQLSFEKETDDSTLLFNHRNIMPNTHTHTFSFGTVNDYDGVVYTYVSPVDDAKLSLYLPADMSSKNPQKIESVGVRSPLVAWFHANRFRNKQIYQHTSASFDATQEADLAVIGDRVLVADTSRADTYDGEILTQDVLILGLSQECTLLGGESIFLQHIDGTVESIGISAGSDNTHVVLGGAPSIPLALDETFKRRTGYLIQSATVARPATFLIAEKEPQENFLVKLSVVNYDARYYGNDKDLINGDVDADGNPIP